jgi:CRISPR-associated protein Csx10
MKAIVYRLRLLEPALIAQAGAGEENSAVALSHIPGSAVRGALAARWLAAHPDDDMAVDAEGRAWFLDGTVCHLNAYPDYVGERTLPMPHSWFTDKDLADDPSAAIYDLALAPDPKLGALKAPSGGPFCRLSQEVPEEAWLPVKYWAKLVKPMRYDQVHIALEDVNKRGEGNLIFRYEALAAGQLFAGAIVAPNETDLAPLKVLLESGDLLLGSAHLAGYGRAAVETCNIVEEAWQEYPSGGKAQSAQVVVTLLSDVIVRGEDGQVGWDASQALALALSCPAGAVPEAAFGRTVLVGGYNRRWSLPLPQEWALAAGSVFIFDTGKVDSAALQRAVERGVGERRAEGYGRIAVGWQVAPQVYRQPEPPTTSDAPPLSPESKKAARALVQRRLRLVLDRALAQRVNANVERMAGPLPENAQLSAIRQATTPGLAGKDLRSLIEHLDNLKSAGRGQLDRCRVGNQTLFAWLRERAAKLDVNEQLLEQSRLSLPVMAGETAALDDALRVEYTARLIDGMMRQAAKQKEARR